MGWESNFCRIWTIAGVQPSRRYSSLPWVVTDPFFGFEEHSALSRDLSGVRIGTHVQAQAVPGLDLLLGGLPGGVAVLQDRNQGLNFQNIVGKSMQLAQVSLNFPGTFGNKIFLEAIE